MLPIFLITGRAVWFVARNAFTLFRLSWLPIVLLMAAAYAMAYGVAHVSPGMQLKEMFETDVFAAAMLTDVLLQGLAFSVIAVAVHRIVLFDDRKPGQYFAFPFGATEFIYVLMGAMTIVALLVPILFANVAVEMLLAWTGVSRGALTENPPVLAAAAVLGLTTYIAFIWLSLRLMLWPPAVVANNKLSLGEAWRLSRGNVFALLALAIASSVAFLVLGGAVAIAAAQTGAIDTLDLSKTLAFEGTPEARLTRIVEHRVNPHVIAYEFAFQFFVTTYAVAVLSYAYKALQGFDIDLPINGQQPGSGGMTPAF